MFPVFYIKVFVDIKTQYAADINAQIKIRVAIKKTLICLLVESNMPSTFFRPLRAGKTSPITNWCNKKHFYMTPKTPEEKL